MASEYSDAFNLVKNMKFRKVVLIILSMLMTVNTFSSCKKSCNDGKSIKILFVANSFGDDTVEYMPEIAKSLGYSDIEIGNLYIGGCSIDRHYNNLLNDSAEYSFRYHDGKKWDYEYGDKKQTIKFAVEFTEWDVVIFQQSSGNSGIQGSYSHLSDLIQGVLQFAKPDVRVAFNMTWAYQADSTHEDFSRYDNNQMTMYNAIISTVKNVVESEKTIEFIIPNGTAIQNARALYGDKLTRDGFHLSYDFGRFIAGLTAFCKITDTPVDDVTFAPKTLDSAMIDIAKVSVKKAIDNPYKIN